MQTSHRSVQCLVTLLLIVFTAVHSEQSDSRRAVAEHQLMHDRGQSVQSLKRLIWLSSAIEGLHTAQTRSAILSSPEVLDLHMQPATGNPDEVLKMLKDFFNPDLKTKQ